MTRLSIAFPKNSPQLDTSKPLLFFNCSTLILAYILYSEIHSSHVSDNPQRKTCKEKRDRLHGLFWNTSNPQCLFCVFVFAVAIERILYSEQQKRGTDTLIQIVQRHMIKCFDSLSGNVLFSICFLHKWTTYVNSDVMLLSTLAVLLRPHK